MDRRVIILTAEGFQDEEYIYCYYRLTEEDILPLIYTPTGTTVRGKYGVPTKGLHYHTTNLPYVIDEQISGILIPGGFEAPGRLRHIEQVVSFIQHMNFIKKPIGAICHGPQALISADVVRGKKITSYKDCYVDLQNAGAIALYMEPVVVDGHIVTSSHYDYNGIFMKAFIELLNK